MTRKTAARRWGALAYVLSAVIYLGVQPIVAAAWQPPYNWSRNYISDLGNTACGPFAINGGSTSYVCSPRHTLMNYGFIVTAILLILGTLLLARCWSGSRWTTIGTILLVLAGGAKLIVGLVPENVSPSVHTLGSLNLPLTTIGILAVSLGVRRERAALASFGLLVAVVGVVGVVVLSAVQRTGHPVLGLSAGGWERVAAYPSYVWLIVAGVAEARRT